METATKYLKVADVCRRFGVNRRTIARWVAYRGMPAIKISPRITRFDPDAVDEWFKARTYQKEPVQ